jgi:hypothetical protein
MEVGGVMFEVIVEVRFTEVMAAEASGFQVMIRQYRPRGRKNSSLILSRKVLVLI